MSRGLSPNALTAQNSTAPKNVPLYAGVPEECVTVGEAFERRLKREADEMQRQKDKEGCKIRKKSDCHERIESQKRIWEDKERDRLCRQQERDVSFVVKAAKNARKEQYWATTKREKQEDAKRKQLAPYVKRKVKAVSA